MLSTGARRNPRGHHDQAGDRYWITSSAVANSVSGMVRPRALAVLRFTAISNFFRQLDAGLCFAQPPFDIQRRIRFRDRAINLPPPSPSPPPLPLLGQFCHAACA